MNRVFRISLILTLLSQNEFRLFAQPTPPPGVTPFQTEAIIPRVLSSTPSPNQPFGFSTILRAFREPTEASVMFPTSFRFPLYRKSLYLLHIFKRYIPIAHLSPHEFIKLYTDTFHQATEEPTHGLTTTEFIDWEKGLLKMTHVQTQVIPFEETNELTQLNNIFGQKTPALAHIRESGVSISESVLTIRNTDVRNFFFALIYSSYDSYQWLSKRRNTRIARILFSIAKVLGHRDAEQQLEVAARLLTLFRPKNFTVRFEQTRLIHDRMARSLEEIRSNIKDSNMKPDLLESVYEYASNHTTDSAKKFPTTHIASSIAKIAKKEYELYAALLLNFSPEDISTLHRNGMFQKKVETERISKLVEAVQLIYETPIHLPEKHISRYTAQFYTFRLFKIILSICKKNPHGQYRIAPDSLLRLVLVAEYRRAITLDPNNKEAIQACYRRIQYVFAPLAEMFGLHSLASQMRNLIFREANPEDYKEARLIHRSVVLKMSRDETRVELAAVAQQIENELARLNVKATESHQWEKTYFQRETDYLHDLMEWDKNNPEIPEPALENQGSSLYWRVNVSRSEELEMIRHRLTYALFQSNPRIQISSRPSKIVWDKNGEIVFQILPIELIHPTDPEHTIHAEIRLMTQDYFTHDYAPNRSKIVQHGSRALAEIMEYHPSHILAVRQEWDFISSPTLTGNLISDIKKWEAALLQWEFPEIHVGSVDPFILPVSYSSVDGQPPVVADIALSGYINLIPLREPIIFEETLDTTAKQVALSDPIQASSILYIDEHSDSVQPLDLDHTVEALIKKAYNGLIHARAYQYLLLVRELLEKWVLPPPYNSSLSALGQSEEFYAQMEKQGYLEIRNNYIAVGKEYIENKYGDLESFEKTVFNIYYSSRLYGTPDDFYETVGRALNHQLDETAYFNPIRFKQELEDFEKWYSRRYVKSQIELKEQGARISGFIRFDENQTGITDEITHLLSTSGFNLVGDFRIQIYDHIVHINFQFEKSAETTPAKIIELKKQFQAIRRERQERTPISESSGVELTFQFKPATIQQRGTLNQITHFLSERNIDIRSAHINHDLNEAKLTLSVPHEYAKNTDHTLIEQVSIDVHNHLLNLIEEIRCDWAPINDKQASTILSILEQLKNWLPEKSQPFFITDQNRNHETNSSSPVISGFISDFWKAVRILGLYQASANRDIFEEPKAAEQLRRSGVSYAVHCFSVVYNLIHYDHVRNPIDILTALLHDLWEDGPDQVWKWVAAKMSDYKQSTSDDEKKVILEQLIDRFENRIKRSEWEKYLTNTGNLKTVVIKLAYDEIETHLLKEFPHYGRELIEKIKRFDRYKSKTKKVYYHKVETEFTENEKAIKGEDRYNNMSDEDRDKLNETLRFFLPIIMSPFEISNITAIAWRKRLLEMIALKITEFKMRDEAFGERFLLDYYVDSKDLAPYPQDKHPTIHDAIYQETSEIFESFVYWYWEQTHFNLFAEAIGEDLIPLLIEFTMRHQEDALLHQQS